MVEIRSKEQLLIWALWVTTVCTAFKVGNCSSPILIPARTHSCICPQSKLELTCTVVGTDEDRTIWAGSAIERLCSTDMQSELDLPHQVFSQGVVRTCGPMDAVLSQALYVNGSCYTSQLIIESVTVGVDGTVVTCQHDNLTHTFDVGDYAIVLTKDPFPPPNDVNLTNMTSEDLTFTWSNVAPDCPAISYDIIADNCGNCPNETNLTTIICSYNNMELLKSNMQEFQCNLSVRSIVCGDTRGEYKKFNFSISLKVKEPPGQVDWRWLGFLSLLLALPLGCCCCVILILIYITNDQGSARAYVLPKPSVHNVLQPDTYNELQEVDRSKYTMFRLESDCELLGFLGDRYCRGCAYYEFVNDKEDITINVKVILVDKTSGKYFSGPAAREIINVPTNELSTCVSKPNLEEYYVFVQDNSPGHRNLPKGSQLLVDKNYIPGPEARPPGRIVRTDEQRRRNATSEDLDELDMNDYTVEKVDRDCGLLQFLKGRDPPVEFSRGCAFYEFTSAQEEIPKDSQIVLRCRTTGKFFTGLEARRIVGISKKVEQDEEIDVLYLHNPHLDNFDAVFLQDRGTGSRYLAEGTHVIVWKEGCGLTEVSRERFNWLHVNEESEQLTFVESHGLPYTRHCAFYEFSHKSEDIAKGKEVLLMDEKKNSLCTGERIQTMIGAPGKGIRNPYADIKQYRVFVQSACTGHRHLDKNTLLLYEKSAIDAHQDGNKPPARKISIQQEFLHQLKNDQFDEIEVDEDCQLTHCLDRNGKQCKGKCIYLELTGKEDIAYDGDVILKDEEGKIYTGKDLAKIIGIPGTDIEKPDIPGYRVFVQCGDIPSDNIWLKRGTSILYKKIEYKVQMQPVKAEEFYEFTIPKTCELSKFVIANIGEFERGRAYFQFTCASEDISQKKTVILRDKQTKELFTGEAACQAIGAPGKGIPRPSPDFKYTVFIQNYSRGSRCLVEGSVLLYRKKPQESSSL